MCHLGGCSSPNALNFENLEGKIDNCALLLNAPALFSLIFSRISSARNCYNKQNLVLGTPSISFIHTSNAFRTYSDELSLRMESTSDPYREGTQNLSFR